MNNSSCSVHISTLKEMTKYRWRLCKHTQTSAIFPKRNCSQDAALPLALLLTWPSIGPTLREVVSSFLRGPPHITTGSVLFQMRIDLVFINWHTLPNPPPFSIQLSFHQVPVRPFEYPSPGEIYRANTLLRMGYRGYRTNCRSTTDESFPFSLHQGRAVSCWVDAGNVNTSSPRDKMLRAN